VGDLTQNFSKSEFACKCGCGFDNINVGLVNRLQVMRDIVGCPITVTSGCRCPKHNKEEGGAPESYHLKGEAVDVVIEKGNYFLKWVCSILLSEWSGGMHFYDSGGDAHFDIGPKRRW